MAVVELEGVTIVRSGSTLLDNVSWTVKENERWVVIGPNGAGKTTLLQIVAAQLHPTRGTATILDETLGAVDVFELRPRIGVASAALADRIPKGERVQDVVVSAAYAVMGRWHEEYDPSDHERAHALMSQLQVDHLDGVVHSIAYANPETALGGKFLTTPFADVATSVQTSAYSLVSLTMACKPLFRESAAVVGLTFDARFAWPIYDWMGVSKAALESASRYLARYLGPEGVRCNLVAAGPLETIAKKAIPGSDEFSGSMEMRRRLLDAMREGAPSGWEDPVRRYYEELLR